MRGIAHEVLRLPVARIVAGAVLPVRAASPVAGAIMLLLVGCGCSRYRAPRQPMPSDEIMTLWSQIREWRREAGMSLDPSCATLVSFAPTDDHGGAGCGPAKQTNVDACSLGDAICDNAEQICILAGEVAESLWAQDKCTSANASCREVQQLCPRVAL
jgi:hypothetical protein